jgi:hypothetical protein
VVGLALLIWRVMARARRTSVASPSTPWPGWDTPATERPTSCMMGTQCAGVIVLKRGPPRPRARPLSAVQPRSLPALDGPAACCPLPAGSQRTALAAQRLSRRHTRLLPWVAADHQRPRGLLTSSHPDWVEALPGDKGNIRHRLHPLEARGLLVIGRSPGGNAASLGRPPEGQQWASPLTGSGDAEESGVGAMGGRA